MLFTEKQRQALKESDCSKCPLRAASCAFQTYGDCRDEFVEILIDNKIQIEEIKKVLAKFPAFPCGSKEEVDEILNCYDKFSKKVLYLE